MKTHDIETKKEKLFRESLHKEAMDCVSDWRRYTAIIAPCVVVYIVANIIPEDVFDSMGSLEVLLLFALLPLIAVPMIIWAVRQERKEFKVKLAQIYKEYGLEPPVDK